MIALTPLYIVIAGMVYSMLLLFGSIWFDKFPKKDEQYENVLMTMLRAGFFTAYAYMGILMWDSVVKNLFLGVLSYNNYSYHVFPILLGIFFGTFLIVGSTFVAPTIKSLITFTGVLIYSIYYFWIQDEWDISEEGLLLDPIQNILILLIVVNLIPFMFQMFKNIKFSTVSEKSGTFNGVYKKYVSNKKFISLLICVIYYIFCQPYVCLKESNMKILWDKSEKFKTIFNKKFYIIIFLVFALELILQFEGVSLLYWLF